ncbi:MAG: ATP-dependent helicase [Lentisphaerae bacterium]|nr:ATP-dependent helicase [Lentisphaerota bacterium]
MTLFVISGKVYWAQDVQNLKGAAMELIYVCKICGRENKIEAEKLLASKELVCENCQHHSALTAGNDTPKRWDESLNMEQERAACYNDRAKALLVLAGAGCGKTKTLIARALFLHRELRVPAEKIALLTFTRKAAKEISERLNMEVAGMGDRMFVGTFHRFCLDLMRHHSGYFNCAGAKLIDRDDQSAVIRKLRNDLAIPEHVSELLVPKVEELCGIISYMNNAMVGVSDYFSRFPCTLPDTPRYVEAVVAKYRKYKCDNKLMDFDDILTMTADNLSHVADFRCLVQNKFDHVLVDEMQDTSPIQWAILKPLYPSVNLFCVGDDAQSIYSFRGADFKNVHNFCEQLPESVTLKLTENYRSSQEILDISNMLLQNAAVKYEKKLRAHNGYSGHEPELYTFHSDFDEANFVLKSIRSKLRQGVYPNQLMLMFRSATHARVIEYTLRAAGIPYRFIGGMSFLQSSHIKDVISALEAVTSFKYELAWHRFLCLHRKLGDKTSSKYFLAVQNAPDHKNGLQMMGECLAPKYPDLGNFLQNFDPERAPAELLKDILDYFEQTRLLEEKYDNWDERKNDLQMLCRIAAKYSDTEYFLEAFKLDPDTEVLEHDHNSDSKITLITVHSAKGSECDYAYICRVQNGVFPHIKAASIDEIEEERRVLYVAMTRARKELIMTRTSSDSSRFLTEKMVEKIERRYQAKGW